MNTKKDVSQSGVSSFAENDWQAFILPDYVVGRIGEDFPEILSRYISNQGKLLGIRQKEISEVTGIDPSLLAKYKYGKQKPTIYAIILLSIALQLTPERSNYLLYSAGYVLTDSMEHRIYKLFLQGCAFNKDYSVENCNKMLLHYGYSKLNC